MLGGILFAADPDMKDTLSELSKPPSMIDNSTQENRAGPPIMSFESQKHDAPFGESRVRNC